MVALSLCGNTLEILRLLLAYISDYTWDEEEVVIVLNKPCSDV
jgi:hypothetical protein